VAHPRLATWRKQCHVCKRAAIAGETQDAMAQEPEICASPDNELSHEALWVCGCPPRRSLASSALDWGEDGFDDGTRRCDEEGVDQDQATLASIATAESRGTSWLGLWAGRR